MLVFLVHLVSDCTHLTQCPKLLGRISFLGAQILNRDLGDIAEITLLTYWEGLECIKAFSGEDISVAKLYPEDEEYKWNPDRHVSHYEVRENMWL
ncbi:MULTISPECIES: antibiotic biosynthesis monooxygenase [Vibrio]|uniref:antibiotic biosynthesis monooxygenase n=1 Tax=Vibrio TaxID=662 RepID=UPI002494EF07|nr:antibiotic biosynthesis monooxygenase [Vibrio diabolicus]